MFLTLKKELTSKTTN